MEKNNLGNIKRENIDIATWPKNPDIQYDDKKMPIPKETDTSKETKEALDKMPTDGYVDIDWRLQ